MLSIGKLGAGQEHYYLDKVAEGAEDYYSGKGEAEGYWLGDGAEDLGLQGKVDADQLIAMLSGNDPATGLPLGLKAAPWRAPVPGFDLTFSAPKSVSLLWALGGHPVSSQVTEAHRAAVAEALAYLERNACWARRGRGGAEFVSGNGFLAAAYSHRSSRAGDPQLHTHALIANATRGPDGRFSRLHHPSLYEHAKTASYIYEAHLRHELTQRLGLRWGRVDRGIADVLGFTDKQLRHFSTRRAEIIEATGAGASAREMQIATLTTRKAKDRDLSEESLRETWQAKGEEVGLDREEIARHLGRERPGETILTAEAVERSVTAHASHFDRRAAIQAVADNLPHGAPAHQIEELADAFLASETVIRIAAAPRGARFTTRRIWELERRALGTAAEMAARSDRGAVSPIAASRVIEARPALKADQREMIERLLTAGRGLEVVIGEAGSGKTFATIAAAEGWAASHRNLVIAAPTWRAAGVLRAEGLDATSVAGLLARLDGSSGEQVLRRGSVLVVDEAGMVDSASLARLIDHAERAEAKLVLIGDPAQLGEIEAGGLFAAIAERTDPIRLHEVIRHRHALDREAAKLIREGRGSEAFERYLAAGRVRVAPDAVERRVAMVADWWAARERGADALMVVKRNSERGALNELAREVLRAEGRLGSEELSVGGRPFAVGDEVITRVNDHSARIYNRERWLIEAVEVESGRLRLAGIDTARRVGVDPGYLERVSPPDGAPALEHAYAATIYQAQGATVDEAFVMADPSMDRQEFYVAASRSREETFFYATPEAQADRVEIAPADLLGNVRDIARAAERDGAQAAAHDAALRERFGQLPSEELFSLRNEIGSEARVEREAEHSVGRIDAGIAEGREELEKISAEWEALGPVPGRFAKRAERDAHAERRAFLLARNEIWRERIERLGVERAEAPPAGHTARAQVAAIDHLLAERLKARLAAVRVDPPAYLTAELGERPVDPRERRAWEKGILEIERFRAQHAIRDKDNALGRDLREGGHRGHERPSDRERNVQHLRELTGRHLRTQQRQLEQVRDRVAELDRDLDREIGRELSIGR